MTTFHQQKMLQSKRLYLPKGRRFRFFMDTVFISGLSLLIFILLGETFISKQEHYSSPDYLIFLIFPVIALALYFHKKNSLKLHELETKLPKQDNYKIVKETIQALHWQIKVDNKGFIEAHTENSVMWSWIDLMFSVVIADKKIMFNSICNVDPYTTPTVGFGQNTKNIKRFKETFELIAAKHVS
jgi:hypothetical protein